MSFRIFLEYFLGVESEAWVAYPEKKKTYVTVNKNEFFTIINKIY